MKCFKLISAAIVIILPISVNAAILNITGNITEISSPLSVESGALESSTSSFVFAEQQSYLLTSDLAVDLDMSSSSFGAGSILSGTKVNSYFFHFDPLGDSNIKDELSNISVGEGVITFDSPILGVIWTGAACSSPCPESPMNLDASDYLGATGTVYPTNGFERGLENDDYYLFNTFEHDALTITTDPATTLIIIAHTYPAAYDQLRIITAAPVPIPPTIWLLGSGLLSLIGLAKRKRV